MRVILLALTGAAALAVPIAFPAAAQVMVDIPIWSNNILGQQAMRHTFDHYDEVHGIDDDDEERPDAAAKSCSADALPAEDRRRMEVEYVRRVKDDGKASADAWVREQGRQFRLRLVAEGVCSDPSREAQAAPEDKKAADGKGCRMVMRPVAGLGGAAMTMGMVPECD